MKLNKQEILRYLSYKRKQELSEGMDQLIEEMMAEVQKVSQPRYTYKIVDCFPDEKNHQIKLSDTTLTLTGNSIYQHLKNADKVALLAATLGIGIEKKIRFYELTDLTKALVLDACCTEYIEKICDLAECDIEDSLAERFTLNRRFSPGYGDLPLEIQPTFLATVEAERKLGITTTDSFLMIPRKSVTAIIGLFSDPTDARPRRKKTNCRDCDLTDCHYRVGG